MPKGVPRNKQDRLARRLNLKGQSFGLLTVESYVGKNKHNQHLWKCHCKCGGTIILSVCALRGSRPTRSCGCMKGSGPRSHKRSDALPVRERAIRNQLKQYRANAKHAGREWALTETAARVLLTSACHYCGHEPNPVNGIDRLENENGYFPQNVVPCCKPCNYAKNVMSYQEFLDWVFRVHRHLTEKLKKP